MRRALFRFCWAVIFLLPLRVDADVITSRSLLTERSQLQPPPIFTITFNEFLARIDEGPRGPTPVGSRIGENVIFTSTTQLGSIGIGLFGLSDNGHWSGTDGFVGLRDDFGTITFTFTNPVNSVGAFLNYAPDRCCVGPPVISALDVNNNVLEHFDLAFAPILTPRQVDGGAFRGIRRTANDIYGFALSNSFVVADDLSFTRTNPAPIPEPASISLLGVGLTSLAARQWRHRRRTRQIRLTMDG